MACGSLAQGIVELSVGHRSSLSRGVISKLTLEGSKSVATDGVLDPREEPLVREGRSKSLKRCWQSSGLSLNGLELILGLGASGTPSTSPSPSPSGIWFSFI